MVVPIYIPLRKREWEFIKNTPESSRVCFSDGQGDNKGWLVVWKVDRWLARNPTIFIIICWIVGTNDSSTKRLMFQVLFFFIISCKILGKNCFNFFYNFTKIKIKSFECAKSIRNYEKNNAWNIRRLVDESFVPSTQRPSVLYWWLTDFWPIWQDESLLLFLI